MKYRKKLLLVGNSCWRLLLHVKKSTTLVSMKQTYDQHALWLLLQYRWMKEMDQAIAKIAIAWLPKEHLQISLMSFDESFAMNIIKQNPLSAVYGKCLFYTRSSSLTMKKISHFCHSRYKSYFCSLNVTQLSNVILGVTYDHWPMFAFLFFHHVLTIYLLVLSAFEYKI